MAEKKTSAEVKPTSSKKVAAKVDKKKAGGLRFGAIVFWVLGLAAEVVAILMLNGYLYFGESYAANKMYWIIGVLALDLIMVIIGSQFWKNANHYDPVSKNDSGVKKFFQNQLGLVVAIIAFMPIIILLLRDKELDGNAKKIVTVVAIVALVIASLLSVDFNAPTLEEMEEQAKAAGVADGATVYWTAYGKSYHFLDNDDATADGVEMCSSLSRTVDENLYSGTLEEAFAANRYDPCNFCVPQE